MVAGQLRLSYHEGIDIVVSIPSQIEEAIAWLKENDVPTRKKFFGDEEITIEDLSH